MTCTVHLNNVCQHGDKYVPGCHCSLISQEGINVLLSDLLLQLMSRGTFFLQVQYSLA